MRFGTSMLFVATFSLLLIAAHANETIAEITEAPVEGTANGGTDPTMEPVEVVTTENAGGADQEPSSISIPASSGGPTSPTAAPAIGTTPNSSPSPLSQLFAVGILLMDFARN